MIFASSGAPRVDRDTVPPHTGARGEDIDARVTVGEADHFPYIEPLPVGDHRKLVGKGDIDVAEGVLDQLGHFGAAYIGGDAFALHEALVEGERLTRAARGDAADRAVVMRQFLEDLARQHAFGTIGDAHIGLPIGQARHGKIGSLGGDRVAHRLGRSDR
jgi:hypothetical protein